jgi:hypothetical protein
MRKLASKTGIFVIVISMIGSSAWADPLAAGKPAGVRKAQSTGTDWAVIGGIAALGAGILIATSGGRSSEAKGQPINITTPATTV